MSTDKISQYYDQTEHREIRADLQLATSLIDPAAIAIDCGCGAGRDIVFLRESGFTVHAFDFDAQAIARCTKRFKHDTSVFLTQCSFDQFIYPNASLVSADASLYFSSADQFAIAWEKIHTALIHGGVFSGSFLGPKDTMASEPKTLWAATQVFTEKQVRQLFKCFEIVSWTEHDHCAMDVLGKAHRWHLYSVVARKVCQHGVP